MDKNRQAENLTDLSYDCNIKEELGIGFASRHKTTTTNKKLKEEGIMFFQKNAVFSSSPGTASNAFSGSNLVWQKQCGYYQLQELDIRFAIKTN